ncbi:MAG: hypothetical protein KC503_41050 [Myxococcales bacterium]|nr:hypothetical protein [Myxococcales bacterium]
MRAAVVTLSALLAASTALAAEPTPAELTKILREVDKRVARQPWRAEIVVAVQQRKRPGYVVFGQAFGDPTRRDRAIVLRRYGAFLQRARKSWTYNVALASWRSTMWPELEVSALPPLSRGYRAKLVKTYTRAGRVLLVRLTRGDELWSAVIDHRTRLIRRYVVFSPRTGKPLRTVLLDGWRKLQGGWLPSRVAILAPGTYARMSLINIQQAPPPASLGKRWLAAQIASKRAPSRHARALMRSLGKLLAARGTASRPKPGALVGVFVRSPELPRIAERRVLRMAFVYGTRHRQSDALRVLDDFIARYPKRHRARRMRARIKARGGVFSDPLHEVAWWRRAFGHLAAGDLLDDLAKVAGKKHLLR